jgi:hypothetical protein
MSRSCKIKGNDDDDNAFEANTNCTDLIECQINYAIFALKTAFEEDLMPTIPNTCNTLMF